MASKKSAQPLQKRKTILGTDSLEDLAIYSQSQLAAEQQFYNKSVDGRYSYSTYDESGRPNQNNKYQRKGSQKLNFDAFTKNSHLFKNSNVSQTLSSKIPFQDQVHQQQNSQQNHSISSYANNIPNEVDQKKSIDGLMQNLRQRRHQIFDSYEKPLPSYMQIDDQNVIRSNILPQLAISKSQTRNNLQNPSMQYFTNKQNTSQISEDEHQTQQNIDNRQNQHNESYDYHQISQQSVINPFGSAVNSSMLSDNYHSSKLSTNLRIQQLKNNQTYNSNKKIFKLMEGQIKSLQRSKTSEIARLEKTNKVRQNIQYAAYPQLCNAKSRNSSVIRVGGSIMQSQEGQSSNIYPFNKSLVSYEVNQKLLDSRGFQNHVTTSLKRELIPMDSHKIVDRMDRYEADFRGKINMIDSSLSSYMNEAKQEFLIKPSPYHTRDEIQKYINSGVKKEKGKKIFNHKGASDFDIIHVHKVTHFTDHNGNFLTKTGHKIDDFSLNTNDKDQDPNSLPEEQANNNNGINRRISLLKEAQKTSNIKLMNKKNKNETGTIKNVQTEKQNHTIPRLTINGTTQMAYQSQNKPDQVNQNWQSQSKLNSIDSNLKLPGPYSVLSEQTGHSVSQQKNNIIQNQGKMWDSVQLKNYSKVKEFKKAKNESEEALVEFINKCDQGLQLPFSLLGCFKKPKLVLDFKITEAAAKGVGEAIKVLANNVEVINLSKLGINDEGLASILNGVLTNQNIEELEIINCTIGPLSANKLIDIINQSYPQPMIDDVVILPRKALVKLFVKDCKVQSKDIQKVLKSMVVYEAANDEITEYPDQKFKEFKVVDQYGINELSISGLKLAKIDSLVHLVKHSIDLQKLNISYNQLNKYQVETLITNISFSHLKYLNLSFNPLSMTALDYLFDFIKYSWNIVDLDLSFTNINKPQDQIKLIQAVNESHTLLSLHLNGIQIIESAQNELRQILGIDQSRIKRRVNTNSCTDKNIQLADQMMISARSNLNESFYKTRAKGGFNQTYIQMSERLVFSRYLNLQEINESNQWSECETCWVCQNYNYSIFVWPSNQQPHIECSFSQNEPQKMMSVQHFCEKLGSLTVDVSSSWCHIIKQRSKYEPYFVLDLDSQEMTSDNNQVWIYADFVEPNVNHQVQIEGQTFVIQVPERKGAVLASLVDVPAICSQLQDIIKNENEIKGVNKLEEQQMLSRINYPIYAYKDLIMIFDEPLSPDSKADKFKILPAQQRNIQDHLNRCFESDIGYTQISSIVENSAQMQRISDLIMRYYYLINDAYLFEIAQSKSYPYISLKQFSDFCDRYNLFPTSQSNQFNQAILRDIYKQSTQQVQSQESQDKNITKKQQKKGDLINRFQMLEMLCRLAIKHGSGDSYHSIEVLIGEKLVNQWDNFNIYQERMVKIYTPVLDEIVFKYQDQIKYMIDKIQFKNAILLQDLTKLLQSLLDNQLDKLIIQKCFVFSKKYVVDQIEESDRYQTIEPREFYEFLIRLAPYVIKEDLPLFYQVDLFLAKLQRQIHKMQMIYD